MMMMMNQRDRLMNPLKVFDTIPERRCFNFKTEERERKMICILRKWKPSKDYGDDNRIRLNQIRYSVSSMIEVA